MPFDMQQLILNKCSDQQTASIYRNKNPKPFTTIKPDTSDEQCWTLTGRAIQEVFEHKKLETCGHFTSQPTTTTTTTK